VSTRGAREFAGCAGKRPRNDASYTRGVGMRSRDFTDLVEPFDWDDLFVRGDLKNGIGRRVENRLRRPQVFCS
jgi:hypothetical protein